MLLAALLLVGAYWAVGALAWLLARLLLVPIGAPRAAYIAARLAHRRLRRDRRGGALMMAAWAALRAQRSAADDDERAAWLEQKLAEERGLRGGGLVAHGLLLALRGDEERARASLRGVFDMDPALVPDEAEALAAQYLIADAAARGAWAEVQRLGHAPQRPRFAAARFMGLAATRLLASGAVGGPDGLALRWCFLRAGAPSELRPLFQAARDAPPPRREPVRPAPPAPSAEPLPAALALHLRTLRRPALFLSLADLDALARAWTAAFLSTGLQQLVLRRAVGLCADAEAAQERLHDGTTADLAELALRGRVPLDEQRLEEAADACPLLLESAQLLRERLLNELEAGCESLQGRVDAGRELPVLDEWREWEGLRGRYELAVRLCGERLRRPLWPAYHRALCAHGVWMFNQRRERVFGNTVARYLLAEAESLGDETRATLQRKNVACGV